jgi:hypothetical protein
MFENIIKKETQISEHQLITQMEFHQGPKFHYFVQESLPLGRVIPDKPILLSYTQLSA